MFYKKVRYIIFPLKNSLIYGIWLEYPCPSDVQLQLFCNACKQHASNK